MDAIIDFKKVANFLKNPPSLEPSPDFSKIQALRKHFVTALAQLQCPQDAVHGWSGLAINPAAYQLLTGNVFLIPSNPGPTAIYPAWAAPNEARMINVRFLRAKKILHIIWQHTPRVLPHARCQRVGPIQGVE